MLRVHVAAPYPAGIMISPLPVEGWGQKPGSASLPFFGVEPQILSNEGAVLEGATEGLLVIKNAWPSTIRDVLGDYERCRIRDSIRGIRLDGTHLGMPILGICIGPRMAT